MKEIEELRKLLHRDILIDLFGRKWNEMYRAELMKSIGDLERKAENNSATSFANKDVLISFLQDAKLLMLETPMDDDTRILIRRILTLLYNWNKAYCNDQEFEVDIILSIRLLDQTLTLSEYLSVSREIIDKLKTLAHFNPPIFNLSRHYLKTLLDKYEDL